MTRPVLSINTFVLFALLFVAAGSVRGQHEHAASDEYRGLRDAELRGMPQETVDGYLAGGGMGLALPAELNGYPGPKHVLELTDELALTDAQRDSVQVLFDAMLEDAKRFGKQLVEAESMLEKRFRHRHIDTTSLRDQLNQLGKIQASLRFTHLAAHLATTEVLSARQAAMYEQLRGYRAGEHPASPAATPKQTDHDHVH